MHELDGESMPIAKKSKWSKGGTLGLVIFTASLIYMIGPALLFSDFYPSIILHPGAASAEDYANLKASAALPCQEYFFRNQHGDLLHGVFFHRPNSQKVVIYHHGNAGNLATRADAYKAIGIAGASIFGYDYRGYGKSTGAPTLQAILDDGLAAFDFVHQHLKYPQPEIINYGESLGAGAAGYVSIHRTCGGLILQSGVPSLPEVGKWHFAVLRMYPSFLFPQPQMDNIADAAKFGCPLVVICGGNDDMIPWHLGKEVYDHARQPKKFVLLSDSHHNAVESRDDLKRYLTALQWVISYNGKH